MSEWISAETPPEEDGIYIVCEDVSGIMLSRGGKWVPYPEPYVVELRHCDAQYRKWMAEGESCTLYWQPLPEPPLEEMIRDRLREGALFLVPGEG